MDLPQRMALGVALLLPLTGCIRLHQERGVEAHWQESQHTGVFLRGKTTRSEVLALLGPPSQVISTGKETALYYLREEANGDVLALIVYNRAEMDVRYDRAIFFFDAANRLTDYSISGSDHADPED